MRECYRWMILSLMVTILNGHKAIISPQSIDDVQEHQRQNLKIQNGYAIIEMKQSGENWKGFNASFLLDPTESLRFVFKTTLKDGSSRNFITLTLTSGSNTFEIPFTFGNMNGLVMVMIKTDILGTFANLTDISFELTSSGELKNNGVPSQSKSFTFVTDIDQEDKKRHIDFGVKWKNAANTEFQIPLNQFAVDAPPTTTTSTTTSTIPPTTTSQEPLTSEKNAVSTPEVSKAGQDTDNNDWIWYLLGFGLFGLFLIAAIIGITCYCVKTTKRKSPTRASSSATPTTQVPPAPQSPPNPAPTSSQQQSSASAMLLSAPKSVAPTPTPIIPAQPTVAPAPAPQVSLPSAPGPAQPTAHYETVPPDVQFIVHTPGPKGGARSKEFGANNENYIQFSAMDKSRKKK